MIDLSEDIVGPVYVYYQLENFYQNHRRYVKSRDYQQLAGQSRSVSDVSTSCDPVVYNANLTSAGITYAFDNVTLLVPNMTANPCGLIAKSVFTDSF